MFEWYLNDPAQVASTQPAESILGRIVPQAAFSDGAVKAATSVPARDASVLLHAPSNMLKVSRVTITLMRSKLADSRRICQGRSDPRRSSKATCMLYQTGDGHHAKENRMSLALTTVGTCVGCFHCSVNCCATATLRLLQGDWGISL